jgi:hypothetical protein
MTEDQYLINVLNQYGVATGEGTAAYNAGCSVTAVIRRWAGTQLRQISWSGSYVKGTAVSGFTDVDLFISLNSNTSGTLQELFNALHAWMRDNGYPNARKQNVSIHVNHQGVEVDLVPGVHHGDGSGNHWLFVNRSGRERIQSNIDRHINLVRASGKQQQIRALKIWRQNHNLDFPSFYLELVVLEALRGQLLTLGRGVMAVFDYLENQFLAARIIDPANTANIISDELTIQEKQNIVAKASRSRREQYWENILW